MRVGTRYSPDAFSRLVEDHPHACGDKLKGKGKIPNKKGSSPCVWGQANLDTVTHQTTRIIPMRVGTRVKLDATSNAI